MTQHGTRQRWQAVVLTIVVCAAYANSLQGSFQYDDFHSIVRNSSLRDLGNLPAFFTDPETFSGDADKAMYRPVLLASLALNHALHGYKVEGYHAVNVMLHAGAASDDDGSRPCRRAALRHPPADGGAGELYQQPLRVAPGRVLSR